MKPEEFEQALRAYGEMMAGRLKPLNPDGSRASMTAHILHMGLASKYHDLYTRYADLKRMLSDAINEARR